MSLGDQQPVSKIQLDIEFEEEEICATIKMCAVDKASGFNNLGNNYKGGH